MKKNYFYALLSAIALTGAMGFSSCTDKEIVDNPNYNPGTDEVVTTFVLNVANSAQGTTRMSSNATQISATDFRGIENAKLFTFVMGDTNDGKHITDSTKTISKKFDLANLVGPGAITTENSSRILEMALPVKTNALVFYGKAPLGTVETADAAKYNVNDVYGKIETGKNEDDTKLSNVAISVANRLGTRDTAYHQAEKLLAGILTCLINTNLSQMTADISGDATPTEQVTTKYGFDIPASEAIKKIKWSDYANMNKTSPVTPSHALYPLEEKLADVYTQMTNIKTSDGELRAASGDAIIRMIQDMWTIASEVRFATPLCYEEAVAKYFAQILFAHINSYFSATTLPVNGTAVSGTGFRDLSVLISAFTADQYWPTAAGSKTSDFDALSLRGTTSEKTMSQFPVSFSIPKGASHILFDNSKLSFAYPAVFNTSGMGTSGTFGVEDYFYCPELLYFANSPIRTSAEDHKNSYLKTVSDWKDDSKWALDWDGQHVTSSTRSVAMKHNVNYGTALLKTTVSLPTDVTAWVDNRHKIMKILNPNIGDEDEKNDTINVRAGAFILTGVIIGGQSKYVGWDMIPKEVVTGKDTDNNEIKNFVRGFTYDKAIPADAATVPTTTGKANYTMVFDNYDKSSAVDQQPPVNVALEFVNNSGKDFYGNHNLIHNGGTFYLIGKLNPQNGNGTALIWPTDRVLPPYDTSSGASIQAKRVFMQDYVTSANFVIGEKSLQNAYLTVPDLRATSLTFGLSVDLEWAPGISFDNVILGQ